MRAVRYIPGVHISSMYVFLEGLILFGIRVLAALKCVLLNYDKCYSACDAARETRRKKQDNIT